MFYTLHCVSTGPDKWYPFKRVIYFSGIHLERFDCRSARRRRLWSRIDGTRSSCPGLTDNAVDTLATGWTSLRFDQFVVSLAVADLTVAVLVMAADLTVAVLVTLADLTVAVLVMPVSALFELRAGESHFTWQFCYFWISCDVTCCTPCRSDLAPSSAHFPVSSARGVHLRVSSTASITCSESSTRADCRAARRIYPDARRATIIFDSLFRCPACLVYALKEKW